MPQRIGVSAVIAGALLMASPAMSADPTPPGSNPDETAIRQVVKQVEDGWNAHDGKAFAAPFTADADYVVINGIRQSGREAIEKSHTAIFTTIYQDSRNAGTVKSIRFLRPDVAVVHVEWNLEFNAGGEPRKGHAMNTMVMTKDGGKWSIAAFQNTSIRDETPRP